MNYKKIILFKKLIIVNKRSNLKMDMSEEDCHDEFI